MSIIDKAKQYLETVRIHLQNENLTDEVSYYAFLISLLPIPGLQQAGQTIDRVFSNKSLKSKLDRLWEELNSTNEKIETIENEIEKLQEIAGTIKYNNSLNEKFDNITKDILADLKENTDWILETENWSYQTILNSIVETDFAQIIARNHSMNTIENSEIIAKKTHLHASNNSSNNVDNTRFSGNNGIIEMNRISTQGNIFVEGSGIGFGEGGSIGFGEGGGLIFGENPNMVSGNCPFCQTAIQVDIRQLSGYRQIQCHNCKKIMPFKIN